MGVYLRLIGSCVSVSGYCPPAGQAWQKASIHCYSRRTRAHYPLSIITHSYTLTGLVEFKVLEELNATGILGIMFETSFSFSGEPFRKRSGSRRTCDGIDRNSRVITDLHGITIPLHSTPSQPLVQSCRIAEGTGVYRQIFTLENLLSFRCTLDINS